MNLLSGIMVLIKTIGLKPTFDSPESTVSVLTSQTTVLPCTIENVGEFEVIWSRKKNGNVENVSLNHRIAISDVRFSIERPFKKDWNLLIEDVRVSDEGDYWCSVNTDPVTSKAIHLVVNSAPKIQHSADEIVVKEGHTIRVFCNATGKPSPRITWYRVSDTEFRRKGKIKFSAEGELLIIGNASRHCQDYYECVAENGVGSPDSHQTRVVVKYAPKVYLPNKRISQALGKMTILECEVSANPMAETYWLKDVKEVTSSKPKRELQMYDIGDNEKILSLTIRKVEEDDFGEYTCVSENILGYDAMSMTLDEYINRNIVTTTTTTISTRTETSSAISTIGISAEIYPFESDMVPDGLSRKSVTTRPQADSPNDPVYKSIPIESRRINSKSASRHLSITIIVICLITTLLTGLS